MKVSHHLTVPGNTSQIKMTFGLSKYILRALLKNRSSFFFGLIFPIVIVSIFGSFNDGSSTTKIGIDPAISANNPVVTALKEIAQEKDSPIVLDTSNLADLRAKISKNDLDAVVVKDEGIALQVLTSNTNPQGKGTAEAFITSIANEINLNAAQNPRVVTLNDVEVSGKTFRAIDFILPGQIGFSLLSVAIFGVAFTFLSLRQTLVLKRIFATSVKPMTFVIAQSLARSVQGVLQALILIVFGVLAFKFHLIHGTTTLLEIAALSFLGVLTFIGFGIFFANIAKDEQTMPIYLNLFNLPQLFLSGVFFSTDALPHWLQTIGKYLPLTYLTDAMRQITVEGAGFSQIVPYLAGMAVWAIISYIIAARTFKAE